MQIGIAIPLACESVCVYNWVTESVEDEASCSLGIVRLGSGRRRRRRGIGAGEGPGRRSRSRTGKFVGGNRIAVAAEERVDE